MPRQLLVVVAMLIASGCVVDHEICGDHRACPGRAVCVSGKCVDRTELPGGGAVSGEGEGEGAGEDGDEDAPVEGEGEAPVGGEGEGEGEAPAVGEGEGEGETIPVGPIECDADDVWSDASGAEVPIGLPCSGLGVCPRGQVECNERTGEAVCSTFPGGSADASADEICDQQDNDCDGVADNGCDSDGDDYCGEPPPGQPPPGPEVCAFGAGDCNDLDPSVHPNAPERCNALDDDCDGTADEGFVGVGEECSVGRGVCERVGVQRCAADGQGLACSVVQGVGREETCNGLDDDCDGSIDETFEQLETVCGECNEGKFICARNQRDVCCSATPGCDPDLVAGLELCDDLDNDCDGTVDEGFAGKGDPCVVGVGACTREGTKACNEEGDDVVCGVEPGEPNPRGELCGNGLDDDCDGEAEEDLRLGLPCESGFGPCARQGVRICDPGGEVLCTAQPAPAESAELCANGIDDDCDGEVDEGFRLGLPCQRGQGACRRQGVMSCSEDGLTEVCGADAAPQGAERCGNRLDDDCDGEIDEGFVFGTQCFSGEGLCARQGRNICGATGLQECDAAAGDPLQEVCGNERDDDCDGAADEGFNEGQQCFSGVGVCAVEGIGYCAQEDPFTPHCDAEPAQPDAAGEICGDGLDNDCDGQVDEGFQLGEDCTVGVGACARDGVFVCPDPGEPPRCGVLPGDPTPELCGNDVDEDCDGQLNNGFSLGEECFSGDGICRRAGEFFCSDDGAEALCDAEAGEPIGEVCGNDRDDDCDGGVDEGFDLQTDAQNCGRCDNICDLDNSVPTCAGGDCVLGPCNEGFVNANGIVLDGCEGEIPLLLFLSPVDGQPFGGVAIVRVQMTGMEPGTEVAVDINRDVIGQDNEPPYEFPFDTAQWPQAEVTLRARAADRNQSLEVEIFPIIDNTPPIVGFLDPNEDEVLPGGLVQVVVEASDENGVGAVNLSIDGEEAAVLLEAPWRFEIDTEVFGPGEHVLTATAIDRVGNARDADVNVRFSFCPTPELVRFGDFEIFSYEASRPDATDEDEGGDERIACSVQGVLPWSGLRRNEAAQVCDAAGYRLCTTAEWLAACEGEERRNYPYEGDYVEENCNGGDVRRGRAAATGEFAECVTPEGVADLSGNLWEWIGDGEDHGPPPGQHVRGGAYTSGLNTLRCQGTLGGVGPESHARVIGFRCCRSAE